jgi:hypothetical protein
MPLQLFDCIVTLLTINVPLIKLGSFDGVFHMYDQLAFLQSLRSEARAWTSMYGKELQSIARDMLLETSRQIDHFITILQQPIVQIKDVTRAHSELISSEIFAVSGGPHLGAIEMIAEWLEAVSIPSSTEIRNDLVRLHEKITAIRLVRANVIQGFKQAQTKLLSAMREEASKFTASVSHVRNDLFGAKGPIQSLALVQYGHDASTPFRNLQMKVSDLQLQLVNLHDAETASELSHTDGKDVEFLDDVVNRYNGLFDLYDDLCSFVQNTYSRNMLELTNGLNAPPVPVALSSFQFSRSLPVNELQKLIKNYEAFLTRILNVPDGCNDNALHNWMKALASRHLAALQILANMQDLHAMTNTHWNEWRDGVLENAVQSGDNTLGNINPTSTFKPNHAERQANQFVSFLRPWKSSEMDEIHVYVGDVLENIQIGFPVHELAEIAGRAAKENAAAQILKKINFEWTTEEFVFVQKGMNRADRRRLQILDSQWARRKMLQMDDDLLSLSEIQLKSMQKDIEFWKTRLFNARSSLQQFLVIQDEWLKYRFYLGNMNDPYRSNVIEQQLIGLFNQMRERPNLIEFCSDTIFSGSILTALTLSLDEIRKSLAAVLDSYRNIFPRLNFVDDADIVNMQYSLSIKPYEMDYMFPLIFTGISRLIIIQSHEITSGRHDDSLNCAEVMDHSGCRLQFTAAGIENPSTSIPIDRSLPVFLSTLCHAMQGTVSQQICDVNEILSSSNIKKLALEISDLEKLGVFSSQAVFVGLRCLWTITCESCIEQAAKSEVSSALTLKPISRSMQSNIGLVSSLIKNSSIKRQYVLICSLFIDLRDATDRLEATAPKQKDDFDFSTMLRYYHSSELQRQSSWVSMVDSNFLFCNEWIGSKSRLVMTPHTLRLFLSVFQALRAGFGVSLTRGSFHGRSAIVEELGSLLGVFCSYKRLLSTPCSEIALEVARSLKGVARNEFRAVLTFEDLFSLPSESISVVCAQVRFLHNQYAAEGGGFCIIPNVEITSIPLIICYKPPGHRFWEAGHMPEDMRQLFRPATSLLSKAIDRIHILSVMLASENIKDFAIVSRKIHAIFEMCTFHPVMRNKLHLFGLTSSIKLVKYLIASASSNEEEEILSNEFLFEAMQVLICSQLDIDELRIFESISKALSGNKLYQFSSNYSKEQSIEQTILQKIDENKLQRIPAQINNLRRLFDTMIHHDAVVVSGALLSGKSTCINLAKELFLAESNSDIQRIHTLRLCPESLNSERLFGSCNSYGGLTQWIQGHQSNSEIQLIFVEFESSSVDRYCLDALAPMLSEKEYYISNRCRIAFRKNIKFLFEVEGIGQLTPAVAGQFGFFSSPSNIVKPEHVLRSCQSHSMLPNITVIACSLLEIYFVSTIKFCIKELAHCTSAPDESIERESILAMNRALRFLDAGLARFFSVASPSLSPDNHREVLERLVIFSTVWGLTGTVIDLNERKKFSIFLQNSTSIVLPSEYADDDCLHNWFLDESGLWQSWTHYGVKEHMEDFFGNSKDIVPTPEMCCQHHLLTLLSTFQEQNSLFKADDSFIKSSKGVFLLGVQSCGKTEVLSSVTNKFFKDWSVRWISVNSKTTSSNIQTALEQLLIYQSGALVAKTGEPILDKASHRQTNPSNRLILIIENLHLGNTDKKECPYALIRSLLAENSGVLGLDPKFSNSWVKLGVSLTTICSFTLANNLPLSFSEYLDGSENVLTGVHRLLNRCVALNMLSPSQDQVHEIFRTILGSGFGPELSSNRECIECICKASISMVTALSSIFPSSASKCHCVFDTRRVLEVAKGMLLAERVKNIPDMINLWLHECKRAYLDWTNASGEEYKIGIKVIAAVATSTRLKNETSLLNFLEENFLDEDYIGKIEFSFIDQETSTSTLKGLPPIADDEVEVLRHETDEEGTESLSFNSEQQTADNHFSDNISRSVTASDLSQSHVYKECNNPAFIKAYFLHSFQVAKIRNIQFTGEIFLFDAFVMFLNRLQRAVMIIFKNSGYIVVVEKMGGNAVNAVKLAICMIEEIRLLDVTSCIFLSQCLPEIGKICIIENKQLIVACSADQQVILADLINLAEHGRVDMYLSTEDLDTLIEQLSPDQFSNGTNWQLNTIIRRTAANMRIVVCVQDRHVDDDWPVTPSFFFHNPDLASVVKRAVILFEPSMESPDFGVLARRCVEKVNRALGSPGLPLMQLALHLGSIPTRCVGSIKLDCHLDEQRRTAQIECSNRYALFLREFQRILLAKARGLQWRHSLLRVARDRIDGVEVSQDATWFDGLFCSFTCGIFAGRVERVAYKA